MLGAIYYNLLLEKDSDLLPLSLQFDVNQCELYSYY